MFYNICLSLFKLFCYKTVRQTVFNQYRAMYYQGEVESSLALHRLHHLFLMHKTLKMSQKSVCLGGENGQLCLGCTNTSANVCMYFRRLMGPLNTITGSGDARWNPKAVKSLGTPALNFGFLLHLHSLCRSTAQPQNFMKSNWSLHYLIVNLLTPVEGPPVHRHSSKRNTAPHFLKCYLALHQVRLNFLSWQCCIYPLQHMWN